MRWLRCLVGACLLLFTSSCDEETAPAPCPGVDPASIDPAALEGCRLFSEPGCQTCYDQLDNVCVSRSAGSSMAGSGNSAVELASAQCPVDQPPCARCRLEEELQLEAARRRAEQHGCTCNYATEPDPCRSIVVNCDCLCSVYVSAWKECPPPGCQ